MYRNVLLTVLLVVLAFNYVDRLILSLVLQEIKTDLALTDTQLGLLSGLAFAFFYSAMGMPIARWADRGNRVAIISITTTLWSVCVALCGLAASFVQLLLVRVGVAVGEAGCIPPALSLIADNFDRAERPRAVARYMLGTPISVTIGYFLAGWVNQAVGWRETFILFGAPGLLVAVIAWLTLREPRKRADLSGASREGTELSLALALKTLWRLNTFRNLLMCFSVVYFFGYGIQQWVGAFFVRSYGLTSAELGTWLAVIFGLGGVVGTYVGGELAARYARAREDIQLRAVAAIYALFGILTAGVYLTRNYHTAFALMSFTALGGAATNGPLFAAIQTVVPNSMRAVSVALIYLFANLIGMGLGPLATGALSDLLQPVLGAESLRYSLLMMSPGYLWAAWHLLKSARTVLKETETARASVAAAMLT